MFETITRECLGSGFKHFTCMASSLASILGIAVEKALAGAHRLLHELHVSAVQTKVCQSHIAGSTPYTAIYGQDCLSMHDCYSCGQINTQALA